LFRSCQLLLRLSASISEAGWEDDLSGLPAAGSWHWLRLAFLSFFAGCGRVNCQGLDSSTKIRSKFLVFKDFYLMYLFPEHELPANIVSLLPFFSSGIALLFVEAGPTRA
jgi:hypothetical protein